MRKPVFVLLAAAFAISILSGCAGAVVGGAAAVGVAVYEERSITDKARDLKIHSQIMSAWLQKDESLPIKLGAEVYEGRAMLTGVVDSEAMRAEAVQLAWQAEGVKQVLNEIQVGSGGPETFARDSWITGQLQWKLTLDKHIMAINYNIETVAGVIYLIGKAQSQAELDRVLAHARDIGYVRDIVNHVEVKQGAA